jgi:hypothetical protein
MYNQEVVVIKAPMAGIDADINTRITTELESEVSRDPSIPPTSAISTLLHMSHVTLLVQDSTLSSCSTGKIFMEYRQRACDKATRRGDTALRKRRLSLLSRAAVDERCDGRTKDISLIAKLDCRISFSQLT